jgi:hypothetical protein
MYNEGISYPRALQSHSNAAWFRFVFEIMRREER